MRYPNTLPKPDSGLRREPRLRASIDLKYELGHMHGTFFMTLKAPYLPA